MSTTRPSALKLSERDFMSQVVDLAVILGWHHYHPHDSRRSVPGYPDLTLVRPPRLVFAELKTDTGRLTREQKQWLDLLAACPGAQTHLWRPSDWDAIVEALR